jgi:dynein heavy chain
MITLIVMDAIQVLFQRPLDVPCKIKTFVVAKQNVTFVADSYYTPNVGTQQTLKKNLIQEIARFSNEDRNSINEETIELLEPFLNLTFDENLEEKVYTPQWAKFASGALVGMCRWSAAMSDYHKASKIVTPKLKFLDLKMGELKDAEEKLMISQQELAEVEELKAKLKRGFEASMKEKTELEEKAARTKKKMDQATRLINSLKDNKERWIKNAATFKQQKKQLVGDVAKACAFVSYCGPFNSEFRSKLLNESFHGDLEARELPVSGDLALTEFFVDHTTLGQWALEGLPADDLSVQNGIMVTQSSRYPLCIDPQGQALGWFKRKEPQLLEHGCIFTLANPRLRDDLKFPLQDGIPVLIESVENEVDPMLDPILEKQVIVRGRSRLLKLGDQEFDYDEKFRMYLTSRLANPHWSPELAAKTTIIDFTVT